MIRQFQPEDAQVCFELIQDCIRLDNNLLPGTLEELLHAESAASICQRANLYYVAVYEIDKEVAGVGGLDMNQIRLLFVPPDRQGEGIGRTLLQHLESMVPPALFSDVFVYSTLAAASFYRHCGYQSMGEHVFNLRGHPLTTVFMVKVLHPR